MTPTHHKNKRSTMKIKPTLFIFIAIIAFVFNCGKSDDTYTVEMKDGVKYVHNHAPLWGDEPRVALEFVQKIGLLDSDDENYLLFNPRDLVRDKEGNIYIADSGNFRVQKFDKNGVYMTTIGRKGQGPGEFLGIIAIDIDKNDNIFVSDVGNSRIQVFSTEGTLIKTITTRISIFRLLKSGNIISWDYTGLRRESADSKISNGWLMAIYNSEGERLNTLIKGLEFSFPNDFDGNFCFFTISDDSEICLTYRGHNRIEKHTEDGTPLFITDRPLKFDPTPEKEVRDFGNELGELTVIHFKFVSWSIGIDYKDRLWVVSLTKQPERLNPFTIVPEVDLIEIHIFDKYGILLYTLQSPVYFMSLRIFGDHLFLIDPHSEEAVYEYKIVDK